MLNREIPFLRICLPLCLGIITGRYYHPDRSVCLVLVIISVVLLSVTPFLNRRLTNPCFGAAFIFSMFIAGLILITEEKERLSELDLSPSVFSGVLTDYPEEKENSRMINVRLDSCLTPGKMVKVKGSLMLYIKKDSSTFPLKPGNRIVFSCTPARIVNRGNPCEFDYKFYMESHGIKYYSFVQAKDILGISYPEHLNLVYGALIVRNRIIEMFRERGVESSRLALASAITLGERAHLDPDQKQHFINAGIMHIMAVSGLHAVILSYFIFALLFFLKGRFNILRVIITITILWGFTFVTGLTPSVLRATLMFSFLQAGKLLKRPVNSINSVLASAFVLILLRPSVIFDAGFLLSYSAVFYIIIFYHDLYLITGSRYKAIDLIWQSACVTISAQAGTLPLTVMLFNRFPTWFILTNVIIVPVSSLVIIAGSFVTLAFPIESISRFFAGVLDKLTWLTEFLTEKAASLPFATIDNLGLTTPECILLSLSISLLIWFLLKKPAIPFIIPLASILLFSIAFTTKHILTKTGKELIVYNTAGEPAVGIRHGKSLKIFTKGSTIPREAARHSSVLGLDLEMNRLPEEGLLVTSDTISIFITEKIREGIEFPGEIDYLVITSRNPFPPGKSGFELPGKTVIMAKKTYLAPVRGKNKSELKARVWQVTRSGAYCKRL